MSTVNPPIWVVNLKRSLQRKDYVERHLTDLGLNFEIMEAVDGNNISEEELREVYSRDAAIRHIGRPLTLSEIGCSLSHIRLYQRIVNEGLQEVIIVEDDVAILPAFWELLEQKNEWPPDWELVLLYHGGAQPSRWRRHKMANGLELRKFASVAYGTVGYIVTRSGAEKLLAQAYPVRVPADGLTGGALPTGVNLFGVYPLCMTQYEQNDESESTMPDAHAVRLKAPSRASLGAVKWPLYVAKHGLLNMARQFNPWAII